MHARGGDTERRTRHRGRILAILFSTSALPFKSKGTEKQ